MANYGEEEPLILSIIGKGANFPFAFSESTGGVHQVRLSGGMSRINGSIHHILTTFIGERFMQPDFGSKIPSLIFEPLDEILKKKLSLYTVQALRKWEKRIELQAIGYDDSEFITNQNTIHIYLEYTIINSQVPGNYTYPWYRGPRPPLGDGLE